MHATYISYLLCYQANAWNAGENIRQRLKIVLHYKIKKCSEVLSLKSELSYFSLGFFYGKKYCDNDDRRKLMRVKSDRQRLMRQIIWVLHLRSRFLRAVILSHRYDELHR